MIITEYTLAGARRISKTSSVRPAAQQHVLACDRLSPASRLRYGFIVILFVHKKNNFIKTWQPTTRERDRQG